MEYIMLFIMTVLSVCIFLVFVFVLMAIYYGYRQISALPKHKNNKSCEWYKDTDELSGEHKTQCGEVFNDATESGNPVTDWITYCPYCPGKVKLK